MLQTSYNVWDSLSQKRIIWPKMPLVLRLRNSDLYYNSAMLRVWIREEWKELNLSSLFRATDAPIGTGNAQGERMPSSTLNFSMASTLRRLKYKLLILVYKNPLWSGPLPTSQFLISIPSPLCSSHQIFLQSLNLPILSQGSCSSSFQCPEYSCTWSLCG